MRTHGAELSVTLSHTQSHNLTLAEEEEEENLSVDIIVAPKDYIAAVAHETQLFVEYLDEFFYSYTPQMFDVCVVCQIIEKRRRDRINNSLSELRRLVPSAFEKQVSNHERTSVWFSPTGATDCLLTTTSLNHIHVPVSASVW